MKRGGNEDMDQTPFDVSFPLPRLRRAVHRVMEKHGQSPFYRKIDWIYKVLRKLQHKGPICMREKHRIRKLINAWLDENTIIHDPESDSEYKKKVMAEIKNDMDDEMRLTRSRAKKKINQKNEADKEEVIKMKGIRAIENQEEDPDEDEIKIISVVPQIPQKISKVALPSGITIKTEKKDVEKEIDEKTTDAIPPCPAAIPIPRMSKEILLIDLEAEEDLNPVKLEEIITINDNEKSEDNNQLNKNENILGNNLQQIGNNPENLDQPMPVFLCPVYVQNPFQFRPSVYQSYPYTSVMPGVCNYVDAYSNCYQ